MEGKITVKYIEVSSYSLTEDGEFTCDHEFAEVTPPCCNGNDCGCYGLYSVTYRDWETGTQETGTQETGTQETGTQDTGTQDTGTQETGTQETGTQETGTQDTGTQDTGTQEFFVLSNLVFLVLINRLIRNFQKLVIQILAITS